VKVEMLLVPERWLAVEAEDGLVLFLAARAKGWPLLFEPLVGVLPERDAPLFRQQPRAPGYRCGTYVAQRL